MDLWSTQRCNIFFRRFIIVSVILPLLLSPAPPPSSFSISILFRFILRRLFFLVYYLLFFPSLRTLYRKRRTKETVTSQLAKLLIYSLFNQINERVDVHFYAPVQLFMVYGNCPKRTRASIGRGRDLRPPLVQNSLPGRPPFFLSLAGLYSRAFLTFFITFFLSFCPFASSFTRLPRPTVQSGLTAA